MKEFFSLITYRQPVSWRIVGLQPANLLWLLGLTLAVGVGSLLFTQQMMGVELYARDWLMRARGPLPAPEQIVILAIDDSSLRRFGRFPWPRELMARVLDNISQAHPRAIGLNVLYAESAAPAGDAALAAAIARAGNVAVAAQLTRGAQDEERVSWLRPLPEIERAAAAVGHVNVYTGADGVARTLLLRQSDDDAQSLNAMAVELVRLGDGTAPVEVRELPSALAVGTRLIPATNLPVETLADVQINRARPLLLPIDYVGPAGAFAAQTISLSEVIDGRVAAERLRGKYVLIGATAAGVGDGVASPFTHAVRGGRTRSELTPGVEVLANQLHTILQQRFYRETPDWAALLCAALVAALVFLFAALEPRRWGMLRQIAAVTGLSAVILAGSQVAFSRWMVLPPLVQMLSALVLAAPLAWLRRTLELSREMDARIAELDEARRRLLPALTGGRATVPMPTGFQWKQLLPQTTPHKAERLKTLHQQMLDRTLFVEGALRSVEDGLIVADVQGRILFANARAVEILRAGERELAGRNLFERISEAEARPALQSQIPVPQTLVERLQAAQAAQEQLEQLIEQGRSLERELSLSPVAGNPRYYTLRVSAAREADGEVRGLVASFTDITRHRELQRTQRDVMALVTHELKTPLTAIQGISELLSQFEPEPAERQQMQTLINDEAKRLTKMIDQYLDLTRLESGVQSLRLVPLRIEQVVARALLPLELLARREQIALIRQVGNDLPAMLGDAELLARALTNLVGNAIKFSPANSQVTLNIRAVPSAVEITIADQGIGIAEEFLPHIFEKFYRVPRSGEDDAPGTGLGLALVREIIELHGGQITVESRPGAGTVFYLLLPLQPPETTRRD
ncbi:MAG TPA: CHASE2 domain-containing protein [Blastocatellia bacterium]|nr:CHASE2 domain-containing protein [Blastocatellia bacterium]HNG31010.1 CHASE2 domain-containing protein [Blastocatellia bacterium]